MNSLYKTTLCRNYMNEGECPYKDKCQFAHGRSECLFYIRLRGQSIIRLLNTRPPLRPRIKAKPVKQKESFIDSNIGQLYARRLFDAEEFSNYRTKV